MSTLGVQVAGDRKTTLSERLGSAHALLTAFGVSQPCFQIFLASRLGGNSAVSEEERALMRQGFYRVYVHAPHTVVPWGHRDYFSRVTAQLELASEIAARGVVIHLNNRWMPDFDALMEFLEAEWKDHWPCLYLENHACAAVKNGKINEALLDTPERTNRLIRQFRKLQLEKRVIRARIGICLDTAHLWGNGCSFRFYEEAFAYLRELEQFDYIFHLNDSAVGLGSGIDRHAALGRGQIWYGVPPESSGVRALLEFAQVNSWPMILERTPGCILVEGDYIRRAAPEALRS